MHKLLLTTVAAGALLAGALAVQASPYDDVPGAGWRSASELETVLESRGWQVDRVKADDGQWEVYGRDPNGRYVEATYDPYTFQQTKVEMKSGKGSSYDSSDDRGKDRDKSGDRNKSTNGDRSKDRDHDKDRDRDGDRSGKSGRGR